MWPFNRKRDVRVSDEWIKNVIDTTLRNHPPECEFSDNVRAKIWARIEPHLPNMTGAELIEHLAQAIEAEEIYCPHEGIDKRLDGIWPL